MAARIERGDAMRQIKEGSQNYKLLKALERGPLTNFEMRDRLRLLKYTSRISDLRAAGHNIICKKQENGVSTYYLKNIYHAGGQRHEKENDQIR